MFKKKAPIVKNRGIHLDLKGMPPTFNRLLEIVDLCSFLRINFILFEMEDMFPWRTYPMLRSRNAYSPVQMKQFYNYCKKKDIQIIPLVQSYGHMENVLTKKEFTGFREHKDDPRDVCPLKGGAREVIVGMIKDVIQLFPDITHFHLGGDEAYSLGNCPKCKVYVKKHGRASLYSEQLNPLLDYVNKQGIRPILWHDMMAKWTLKELRWIKNHADLMVWIYNAGTWDKNNWDPTSKTEDMIGRFRQAQITLWGAGAYRCGGEGIIPDIKKRAENMKSWSLKSRKMHLKGLVATGWTRNSYLTIPYGPFENAFESLCLCSKIMLDGEYNLESDMKKVDALCSKWRNSKLDMVNKEFKNLLAKTEMAFRYVDEDRGLREGGPCNVYMIRNAVKVYKKAMRDFNIIEKEYLKVLRNYAFAPDVRKWVRAHKGMVSDRFAWLVKKVLLLRFR